MASVVITQAELLEALATAAHGDAPEDAKTVHELTTPAISVRRVRDSLRILQAQGRLQVHRVVRPALDGRASIVPAYTILPPRA